MFSRYASQLPGRPRRARLGLEPLDSRVVPAVVLTQLDLDGDGATDDIRIVGDLRNNKITIHDNGQASVEIQVDGNGDGDTLDAGDLFQSFNFTNDSLVLEVNLGGGNDSFQYFVDQNFDASARTLAVNLGAGNDAFVWQMNNHQVGPQSRIALDVTAGGGADKVNVTFDKVMTSVASVHADLGAGVDTYDLAFGRIDNKASVDVDTELGAGPNTNTVAFQGIGIFDKAEMDMTIVGGPQKDTVDLQMLDDVGNGVLASQAVVSVDLLAGDDVFKGSLDSGGNIFRVDDHSLASISVRGGLGNDNLLITRNGTGQLHIDSDGLMAIDLDGGAGNDTLGVNFGGTDAWWIQGGLRVRLNGGLGNDVLSCLLSNTATTTGVYDVAVRGGAGNDVATFSLVNSGGTPTFGPAGGVIVDGGIGSDTLTNANPQVTFGTAFETIV